MKMRAYLRAPTTQQILRYYFVCDFLTATLHLFPLVKVKHLPVLEKREGEHRQGCELLGTQDEEMSFRKGETGEDEQL